MGSTGALGAVGPGHEGAHKLRVMMRVWWESVIGCCNKGNGKRERERERRMHVLGQKGRIRSRPPLAPSTLRV